VHPITTHAVGGHSKDSLGRDTPLQPLECGTFRICSHKVKLSIRGMRRISGAQQEVIEVIPEIRRILSKRICVG
jgi:hypothetical protein